ncbi:MAG TPA: hypothetical protein VFS09_12430, partial [Candidatus Eisenbacteria bacterium]|nr:hypothetical protein [Candidatus Eisenbacteria bacterium]
MIALLLAAILGCSNPSPLTPAVPRGELASSGRAGAAASGYGDASYYPLGVGNKWIYSGSIREHVYDRGGTLVEVGIDVDYDEVRHLIGTTQHEGLSYVVEETTHRSNLDGDGPPTRWWFRWRQDRAGLFGLDTVLFEPPPMGSALLPAGSPSQRGVYSGAPYAAHLQLRGVSAETRERLEARLGELRALAHGWVPTVSGGAKPASRVDGELTELVYPVRPGAEWSIRSDFPWPARVAALEVLDTPAGNFPAARVDIFPPFQMNEDEWVRVWYSRSGYLGYWIRFVYLESDEPGGEP